MLTGNGRFVNGNVTNFVDVTNFVKLVGMGYEIQKFRNFAKIRLTGLPTCCINALLVLYEVERQASKASRELAQTQ